jgi:hypothetical protein
LSAAAISILLAAPEDTKLIIDKHNTQQTPFFFYLMTWIVQQTTAYHDFDDYGAWCGSDFAIYIKEAHSLLGGECI